VNLTKIPFGLLSVLFCASALGIIIWLMVAANRDRMPVYYTWDEIRSLHPTWTVVREPNGAGPFRRLGDARAPRGEPISGSVRCKSVATRFQIPADPAGEFRVVGLVSRDGAEPTYAVLFLKDGDRDVR
jgi:hypothetical protein